MFNSTPINGLPRNNKINLHESSNGTMRHPLQQNFTSPTTSTPFPPGRDSPATPTRLNNVTSRRYSLSDSSITSPVQSSRYNTTQNVHSPLAGSSRYNLSTQMDVKSPGLTGRLVRYNEQQERSMATHQPKYNSPGVFPIVHLFKKDLPVLKQKPNRVTVRMASSELSKFNTAEHNRLLLEKIMQPNLASRTALARSTEVSTRSVLDALKEISRKRIHSSEEECDFQDEGKRMRLDCVNGSESKKRLRETSPPMEDSVSPNSHYSKKYCSMDELMASKSSSMEFVTQRMDTPIRKITRVDPPDVKKTKLSKLIDVETQTFLPEVTTTATEPTPETPMQVTLDAIPEHTDSADEELTTSKSPPPVKIFDEKPLEVMRRNRLSVLMGSLSGDKLPVLTTVKSPETTTLEEVTSPKKPLISILSAPSKSPHKNNKHVTFSIPQGSDSQNTQSVSETDKTETITTPVAASVTDTSKLNFEPKVKVVNDIQPPTPSNSPVGNGSSNESTKSTFPASPFSPPVTKPDATQSRSTAEPEITQSANTKSNSEDGFGSMNEFSIRRLPASQFDSKDPWGLNAPMVKERYLPSGVKVVEPYTPNVSVNASPKASPPKSSDFSFNNKPMATSATIMELPKSLSATVTSPKIGGFKFDLKKPVVSTNSPSQPLVSSKPPTSPSAFFQTSSTTKFTFGENPKKSSPNSSGDAKLNQVGSKSAVIPAFGLSTPIGTTSNLNSGPTLPNPFVNTTSNSFAPPVISSSNTSISASVGFSSKNTPSLSSGSNLGNKPLFSFGANSTATTTASSFVTSTTPTFGSTTTASFGVSKTHNFGASTTAPSFGTTTAPNFGAISLPAFGTTTAPSFGTTTAPTFGTTTAPAFGTTTAPSFGITTAPTFGTTTAPAFGTTTAPSFGTTTAPTFGTTTAPTFGTTTAPTFGTTTAPPFGTNPPPSFGTTSTPSFGTNTAPSFGTTTAPSFGTTTPTMLTNSKSPFGTGSINFNTKTTQSFNLPVSTSTFTSSNKLSTAPSTTIFGGSIFTATASAPSNSTFGSSTSSTTLSMFGNNNAQTSTFSKPSFGGGNATPFAVTTTTAPPTFGTNNTSTFTAPNAFTAVTTTSNTFNTNPGFVTTSAGTFGSNTSTFGTHNFGKSSNTPTPSFTSSNIFGTTNTTFGATTTAATFGPSNTPSFGATTTAASTFGGTTNTPSFGVNNATNNFATPNAVSVFGSTTNPTFNANPPTGFAASTNNFSTPNNSFSTNFGNSSSNFAKPAETNFGSATPNSFGTANNNFTGFAPPTTQASGVFTFGASNPPKAAVFSFGSSEPPKPSFNFTGSNSNAPPPAFGTGTSTITAAPSFGGGNAPAAPTFGGGNVNFAPSFASAPAPQFNTAQSGGMFSIGSGSSTPGRPRTQLKAKRRT